MKPIKDLMKWRFACKHFDPNKKIDDATLKDLLDTARLSPNSYGIQAWKFVVVTNKKLQEKLVPACYNQPQITEAAALVFFCARTDLEGPNGILEHFAKKAQQDLEKTAEELAPYHQMISGDLLNRPKEGLLTWTQRQVYIPATVLILAAAEKEIDTCPMEGFIPSEVAKILELPNYMHPTVLVSMGYRNMTAPPKTRFDFDEVVEIRA